MSLSHAVSPTLQEVLSSPVQKPLSREEDKGLGSLLRRKATQTGTPLAVPIFTGGRTAHVAFLPAAQQGSSKISEKSKKRRQLVLQEVERTLSGSSQEDTEAQRAYNIGQMSQKEREALVVKSNIKLDVPAEDVLSLGLHLRLSNQQQRKLQLWTQQWHLNLASEKRTRAMARDLLGEVVITSELVQTINDGRDCERVFAPAVLTQVTNPMAMLLQHLEHLLQNRLLVWHDTSSTGPSLPKNEIWVKVGGDKGGGSFKFCLQVVNRESPNSADHTVGAVNAGS